jgi:Fe2+ transport system protein B
MKPERENQDDLDLLSKRLGIPVVRDHARSGKGLDG